MMRGPINISLSYCMGIDISVLLFCLNSYKHSDTPKPDIFHAYSLLCNSCYCRYKNLKCLEGNIRRPNIFYPALINNIYIFFEM